MILDRLLRIIEREPYLEGHISWTEETYMDMLQDLKRNNFSEYLRYLYMYEEVRNRKLEDYYSTEDM